MVSLCWTCYIHKFQVATKTISYIISCRHLTTYVYAQLFEKIKLLPARSPIHAEVKITTGFQLRLCIELSLTLCIIEAVPCHCAGGCVCVCRGYDPHDLWKPRHAVKHRGTEKGTVNNDVSVANMQNKIPIHTAIACDVVWPNVSTIEYRKREVAGAG